MSTATAVAPLTIQDAEALVDAARRAAEAAGATVVVTVLDAGGHLLAFRRDDLAILIAGETSTLPQAPNFVRAGETPLLTPLSSSTPRRPTWSKLSSRAGRSTLCRPRSTGRSCLSRVEFLSAVAAG